MNTKLFSFKPQTRLNWNEMLEKLERPRPSVQLYSRNLLDGNFTLVDVTEVSGE